MNAARICLILICSLRLLLPAQTVLELFKLPFLVIHFLHHHHSKEKSPVLDFLTEHYDAHDHHNQDTAEHKAHHKLPFGSHHTDDFKETIQLFLTVTEASPPTIKRLYLLINQSFNLVEPWYSQFSPSIWQPPKIS